jgi:NAD(P)-dependent dehydrogenase (short-subunit alcohol dehydrogenase family)
MTQERVALIPPAAAAMGGGGGASPGRGRVPRRRALLLGEGEALAKELAASASPPRTARPRRCGGLVDLAVERWGRVDVLVTAPGTARRAPILELTDEDWQAGMETYLLNVIRADPLVAPIMKRQHRRRDRQHLGRRGSSSRPRCSPTRPRSFAPAWRRFTKSLLRHACCPSNIRMNNVLPGWIDSLPAKDERAPTACRSGVRHERSDRRDDRLPRLDDARNHRPESARGRRPDRSL